jgi:hypothetical protein
MLDKVQFTVKHGVGDNFPTCRLKFCLQTTFLFLKISLWAIRVLAQLDLESRDHPDYICRDAAFWDVASEEKEIEENRPYYYIVLLYIYKRLQWKRRDSLYLL